MPKHEHYQDYVIKSGEFIGDFEQMYRDHEDPWHQNTQILSSARAIALNWCKKIHKNDLTKEPPKIVEIGCGLGVFTSNLHKSGFDVLGVDISETAILKARKNYNNCNFTVADILDFHVYEKFQPQIFIMSEITWYVLDKLDLFLNFLKKSFPNSYLMHILTTYPKDKQSYGKEYFTNLSEIMSFFNLNYIEYGECKDSLAYAQTFFISRI